MTRPSEYEYLVGLCILLDLASVLRPRQHSTGYMGLGDGFYRSKDPTNSIKVLNEQIVHRQMKHTIADINTKHSKSPSQQ